MAVCLPSSPLSPKHCCRAAFKSTGNALKGCVHSFSLFVFVTVTVYLHSASQAATVFRSVNSLCWLIACVGNKGWYQNNQISPSFTAELCALQGRPRKALPWVLWQE